MSNVDFTFWDNVDKSIFIKDDRLNSARNYTAKIIRDVYLNKNPLTSKIKLLEVGFGPGFDLLDHFWPLIKNNKLIYTGFEGSISMIKHVNQLIKEKGKIKNTPILLHKTFDDIQEKEFDIIYTKATLEHQLDFHHPLHQLILGAKKMIIINFYRPPAEQIQKDYNITINMHSITWKRSDIENVIREMDCSWNTYKMPKPPYNEIWIIKK